jgi:hypothetical protein
MAGGISQTLSPRLGMDPASFEILFFGVGLMT